MSCIKPSIWRHSFKYPQNRIFLLITIIATLMFSVSIGNWYLTQNKLIALELKAKNTTEHVREQMRLKTLGDAFSQTKTQLEILEPRFMQQISQATLVQKLDALAQRDGINIISEDFESTSSHEGHILLLLDLTVEAHYLATRDFLKHLEELPTMFVLNELSLSQPRASGNQIRAQLKLTFFNNSESDTDTSKPGGIL